MSTEIESTGTEVPAEAAAVEKTAARTARTTRQAIAEPAAEPAAELESLAKPADQAIDAVTARQQEAIEAVEAASATVIESVTLAQRTIAEFVSTRIRADIETQQQLLRCKSFDEIRSIQSEFLKTAVEQYSDNAQRLFKLGQEIVSKSTHRGAA